MSKNQMRNKAIMSYPKTDRQKLAGLEIFLHKKFLECSTLLEGFMLFTKGEDDYVGFKSELNWNEVAKYKSHPPDILLFLNGSMIILELDGPIHDIKTEKTNERNKLYNLNGLSYIVVNETDLKFELNVPKSTKLSQDQINEAFYGKIIKL